MDTFIIFIRDTCIWEIAENLRYKYTKPRSQLVIADPVLRDNGEMHDEVTCQVVVAVVVLAPPAAAAAQPAQVRALLPQPRTAARLPLAGLRLSNLQ